MPDIRLVRRSGSYLWIWTAVLAMVGLLIWASAFVFGDPTDPLEQPRVGAAAEFGAQRAPVLPLEPVPFSALVPLSQRDLGRFVQVRGSAQSRVVRGNVWIRTDAGYGILLRVEPPPVDGTLGGIATAGGVQVEGYLQNISRAEFSAWMDSLGVRVPRPPPAPRFGQLPDPAFARLDSLTIRDYYISVRPEALQQNAESGVP